jgi:hypothetical protein
MSDTIGYSGMPCTDTMDLNALVLLQEAYDDCVRHNNGYPPQKCTPPQFCQWNTCSAGTTGGTPITAQVLFDIGDFTGCVIARLQEPPSPSVVELTLIIVRGLGI